MEPLPEENLREGIATAQLIALQLAQTALNDSSLGSSAQAISAAWYQLLERLTRAASRPGARLERPPVCGWLSGRQKAKRNQITRMTECS